LHHAYELALVIGSVTILEHLLAEGLGFETKSNDGRTSFERILHAMKNGIASEDSLEQPTLWNASEAVVTFAIGFTSVESFRNRSRHDCNL
jgi:hypothetical protein